MGRLFVKLFLWFWLTMTLVGAILVVLALTTDHEAAMTARHTKRFTPIGRELVGIYEEKGLPALAEEVRVLKEREKAQLVLVHDQKGPLTLHPLPSRLQRYFDKDVSGERAPAVENDRRHWGKRNDNRFVIPLDGGYSLFVNVPPPTMLEHLLDPRALTLRLMVTFLVAGIVCFFLARSLTVRIMKLRQATQNFAVGNLAARVAHLIGGTDEITDLANDFDSMAERIATLLHSQQRLLRDISHELRSPLARLNVALELVRQRSAPEAAASLDRIEKEALRLNEMIGQLLTLTQLESRSGSIDQQIINLDDFLNVIVQDANYEAQNRNRSVQLAVEKNAEVVGAPELLHRALENVIRNALSYTKEGSTVEITLDRANTEESVAMIRVRDQGPGVPDQALSEIFRPFYRVEDARDRQRGGTGVGLAIAEQSIRLHGGSITAANIPEGGLELRILLPCRGDK